ncbi:lipoprotein [Spiroplasma endosymbiont of Phyllotreta cruciferae]|uniref:lipoprotein n=1 Tax=Spiroplasma endosymbiont of Phyllotreta cruciferae TaxID=2886375 RepID=UPI0020A14A5E|nr:lipoprotein [Spiroplasma endosymbiont of Phyllotreta cruciferae]
MKKLLSILGTITLVGTVAPNVVACHNKKLVTNESITAKDLQVFNEIQAKAGEKINQKIKNIPYIDSIKSNLSKIYSKVNKGDTDSYQLKLSNPEDNKIVTYFINSFTKIFDNVNHDLQNEYSNYFVDEMPLTLDDEKNIVKVTFIDVENLRNKFPSDVNPEPFSAVLVDYKATLQLKFKQIYASFGITSIYNVTENVTALHALSDKAVSFLIENIKDYFIKLETVNFGENELFKPLYDQMMWDFGKYTKPLDDIFKTAVKNYIISQKEFQNISITYNDTPLIEKEQNGALTSENKGYDGLTNNAKKNKVLLQEWIGEKMNNGVGWDSIDDIKPTDFVDFYKNNVGPVFNVDDNVGLDLGTLKIKLNYFNIYGLGLSGNVTNKNNEDATITLNLSRAAIDKKLVNWGKIIIQFIKYAKGGTFISSFVEFRFPNKTFKKVLEQNKKDGLQSVINF